VRSAGEAGPRIAALVMAAGESRRFGSPKQLHVVHGEPIIRHTVSKVLASSVDAVVVVLGHAGDAVEAALSDLHVRFARNPDPAAGLGRSIAAGVSVVDESRPPVDALIIVLGDQPTLPSGIIDRLCTSFRSRPADIIALEYDGGVRAPPVLFARGMFDDMRTLSGDAGARELLGRGHSNVRVIRAGIAVPDDIDTVADLHIMESRDRTNRD